MELILVRHGESEGNISGKVYGQMDYPLTIKGEQQAKVIREFLEPKKIDVVYTSPLIRAKVIGEGIAKDHNVSLIVDDDAREIDFGPCEDVPVKKLKAEMGVDEFYKMLNPFLPDYDVVDDKGRGFKERVESLLERIIEEYGNTDQVVALTCHQGVIRIISSALLEYEPKLMMHYKWEPGCIARFQIKKGFGKLVELIQTY